MIKTVTIEGFKSLESVKVELGRVNVFIGANGSGKSNLLEAIGVLGAAAFGRVDDEALLRRGVRPGVPQLYASAFPRQVAHEGGREIILDAENDAANYRVSLSNPFDHPRPAWQYRVEVLKRQSSDVVTDRSKLGEPLNPDRGLAALEAVSLTGEDSARKLIDDLSDYSVFCANTPVLRGLAPDPQSREPLGLSGGRLAEAVLQLWHWTDEGHLSSMAEGIREPTRQIVDLIGWADRFDSAPSSEVPLSRSVAASARVVRFRDRFMAKGHNILTGYDASEGALYVLFAAVLALHPRAPACLAVDNLDQTLNPRLATRLMEAFCTWILRPRSSRQALVTVHNPTVLDGLPLKDDRVRLFAVDRDNRGRTVIRRVKLDKGVLDAAAQGWTLSRMWVKGSLGGVPNV